MSDKDTGMVSFTLDPKNPPHMTQEQHDRLDAMRDEEIDFSDIPPMGDRTGWVRGGVKDRIAHRMAVKSQARAEDGVVQLQADVLSFFKESGDASEERINAVLREYAEAHRKTA